MIEQEGQETIHFSLKCFLLHVDSKLLLLMHLSMSSESSKPYSQQLDSTSLNGTMWRYVIIGYRPRWRGLNNKYWIKCRIPLGVFIPIYETLYFMTLEK